MLVLMMVVTVAVVMMAAVRLATYRVSRVRSSVTCGYSVVVPVAAITLARFRRGHLHQVVVRT